MEYIRKRAACYRSATTSSRQDRSQLTNFDLEIMICSFESIHNNFLTTHNPLPLTAHFLSAMQQLCLIFDTLGSAFVFVKRDITSKIHIINQFATDQPNHYSQLQLAVEYELENANFNNESLANSNCTRTILRLMWALKFVHVLLEGLAEAFDNKSCLSENDRTLCWAVSRAYSCALAEHHSWPIRKTVQTACAMLPTKESFMHKIAVKDSKRESLLRRIQSSMSPLVKRMYTYYEQHDLLSLQ